jgi:predicted DNA-binding transcriptional regulator AlpA
MEESVPGKPRRILPARDAYARTGVTRAQAWAEEKAGRFPHRVQITPFRIGYFEDEIDHWIANRPRAGAAMQTPKSPGRLGKRGAVRAESAIRACEERIAEIETTAGG